MISARWSQLVMLNYVVPPEVLLPRVPQGTTLDAFDGQVFVSVVGFLFEQTRCLGIPLPGHQQFEEVNLRFYVLRESSRHEPRRGVVFVKEIVPKPLISWTARTLYNEQYVTHPMSHALVGDVTGDRSVQYSWQATGSSHHVAISVQGAGYLPDETSEEAFITEHYYGYCSQRNGTTLEYKVEHPRWNVWQAASCELHCDVAAMYGPEFVGSLSGPPHSAFLADGSAVTIHAGKRLRD